MRRFDPFERDDRERRGRTPEPPPGRTPNPPIKYGLTDPVSGLMDPVSAHKGDTAGGGGQTPFGASGASTAFGGSMPNWGGAGDPASGQSGLTWGILKGIMTGEDVPFGQHEIDLEKGQAKTASENTFNQAKEQIQGQQAQTGFASSPAALRPLVGARIAASQQYGAASNEIAQKAAQNNFNARLSALNSAQSWVDSLRSYVATMTGSWWQRQQAQAQLALAQRQLDEQMRQFDISTGLGATR